MVLVAGVALVLAAGAFLLVSRLRKPGADRHRVAIAVFVNRTGDSTLEPFGSMLADWVTRGVTQAALVDVVDVGAIHVQGRSPEGQPTDPYELARRNGAGTVVSGSYYLATDTLVVRATVEDAVAGTVLQTVPPVHVPATAAVRALDEVKERVLVALGGVFDVRYAGLTARASAPESFQAYQQFLAGQEAYWLGHPPQEVRGHFARAAAEDSSFTAPAVWLAFIGANRLRAHGLRRHRTPAEARPTVGIRPPDAGHQRGPVPQRLAGGLPARAGAGSAQAEVHVCRLHRRLLRTDHQSPPHGARPAELARSGS
jgi:TolB-like protein